ncbi:hypothetical protein KOR42_43370 [Thalassoglobus neptunius]|uniref:Uncharacterized protein n=1 Tax=Thalassoglobus neptunius TaxID=1938619 RepID=A0A5C5W6P7_9PLAN|nr:hypothetical protein KOR42_43370 [Thalassoglobus neptunius]
MGVGGFARKIATCSPAQPQSRYLIGTRHHVTNHELLLKSRDHGISVERNEYCLSVSSSQSFNTYGNGPQLLRKLSLGFLDSSPSTRTPESVTVDVCDSEESAQMPRDGDSVLPLRML